MTTRFIKLVTLVMGLTLSVQSVWAACEAEIQQAIERQLDNDRKFSPGQDAYHTKIQQDYWFQIDKVFKEDYSVESLSASLKRSTSFGDLLREKYRSSPNFQLDLAKNAADLCLINFYLNLKKNQNSKITQSSNMPLQRQEEKRINENQARGNQEDLRRQAQQSAQETQARADQQRQGKRKTNDPAAQAHACVEIDKAGSGNFGAFKNTCNFKVNFSTCNYKPRTLQGGFNWSADFDCEKNKFGLHTPDAGRSVAAHNRNTEMVYWFACKAPATPVDAAFVVGKGIEARCHN